MIAMTFEENRKDHLQQLQLCAEGNVPKLNQSLTDRPLKYLYRLWSMIHYMHLVRYKMVNLKC